MNPFMQGKTNFNPQQVDQLLMGNTVEENTALRGIAARIVEQQLAAEPAPSAIDVTLPERGRVVTFTRSLQVDGSAPLDLTLAIEKLNHTSAVFVLVYSPRWLPWWRLRCRKKRRCDSAEVEAGGALLCAAGRFRA